VGADRVGAEVGEVEVQRHQHPTLRYGGRQQDLVGLPGEVFVVDRVGVMAGLDEGVSGTVGEVFVELEPYRCLNGRRAPVDGPLGGPATTRRRVLPGSLRWSAKDIRP